VTTDFTDFTDEHGDFQAAGAANFSIPAGRADTRRLELAGTFGVSEKRFYPYHYPEKFCFSGNIFKPPSSRAEARRSRRREKNKSFSASSAPLRESKVIELWLRLAALRSPCHPWSPRFLSFCDLHFCSDALFSLLSIWAWFLSLHIFSGLFLLLSSFGEDLGSASALDILGLEWLARFTPLAWRATRRLIVTA
jgi:hypothetical protein